MFAMVLVMLYLLCLYVRPQDWVPGITGLPTAFIILPMALMLGFVARAREPERFQTPQTWILPLYLALIFATTLVNVDLGAAFGQFDLFARRVAVFYIIVWLVTTTTRLEVVIWSVLLLSAFLAFQAILQAQTGTCWGGLTPFPGYDVIRVRWYGDWDGPNVYGILFVMAVGLSLELVFGPHSVLVRLAGVILTLAYFAAIFYTNSRGAVLALALMVMFYLRERFKSKLAIGIAVAAVASVLVLAPSRMSEVNSKESSARERTWLWEQGLNLLRTHPVLGVGRGEFHHRVNPTLIAHNNYVQNFAESGLLGFFCFTALLWFSFKGNYILSRVEYGVDQRLVALSRMMTAVVVGYMGATFFVVMELDLLYFLFGLCAAVYLVARHRHSSVPKLALTKFDFTVIVAGMFGIIFSVWLAAVKHIV